MKFEYDDVHGVLHVHSEKVNIKINTTAYGGLNISPIDGKFIVYADPKKLNGKLKTEQIFMEKVLKK